MKADSEGSRTEPGCLRFDVMQDSENPCKFWFYEAQTRLQLQLPCRSCGLLCRLQLPRGRSTRTPPPPPRIATSLTSSFGLTSRYASPAVRLITRYLVLLCTPPHAVHTAPHARPRRMASCLPNRRSPSSHRGDSARSEPGAGLLGRAELSRLPESQSRVGPGRARLRGARGACGVCRSLRHATRRVMLCAFMRGLARCISLGSKVHARGLPGYEEASRRGTTTGPCTALGQPEVPPPPYTHKRAAPDACVVFEYYLCRGKRTG